MKDAIYLDFETTGLPFESSFEIISGFLKCGRSELEIRVFPRHWTQHAARVHGLSYNEVMRYPRMEQVFPCLHAWLLQHRARDVWCYARPQNGILFDRAVLQLTYAVHARLRDLDALRLRWNSVYLEAKLLGLKNTSQIEVYRHLFGRDYTAHDARSDVLAMIEIHNRLRRGNYVYQN